MCTPFLQKVVLKTRPSKASFALSRKMVSLSTELPHLAHLSPPTPFHHHSIKTYFLFVVSSRLLSFDVQELESYAVLARATAWRIIQFPHKGGSDRLATNQCTGKDWINYKNGLALGGGCNGKGTLQCFRTKNQVKLSGKSFLLI